MTNVQNSDVYMLNWVLDKDMVCKTQVYQEANRPSDRWTLYRFTMDAQTLESSWQTKESSRKEIEKHLLRFTIMRRKEIIFIILLNERLQGHL